MTLPRALAAVLLLAAADEARAFVRETTAVGDPASGRCLWWGTRSVKFKVNATSAASPPSGTPCASGYCMPCLDASLAAGTVAATLPIWGDATRTGSPPACTDLALTGDGTSTATALGNDGVNLVVFRVGYCGNTSIVPAGDSCRGTIGACAAKYNCWEHDLAGTLGLTTTTFKVSSGQFLDADVEFHGWNGQTGAARNGYYLTCGGEADPLCSPTLTNPPEAGCTSIDVASLALHEAGHLLGLDHTCQYADPYYSCTADSVMQPTLPNGTRRALNADDVDGICTIYPAGAATLTCGSDPVPEPVGGCGCGSGNGGLGLAVALLAAFRARRRRG